MREMEVGGDVIERDGLWRKSADVFPAYHPDIGGQHLKTLHPEVFDSTSGMMVITCPSLDVRTPHDTILVDTCAGEDKGHPASMDFPK